MLGSVLVALRMLWAECSDLTRKLPGRQDELTWSQLGA